MPHLSLSKYLRLCLGLFLALLAVAPAAAAGDEEYTGQFLPDLIAREDDMDQVILRPFRDLSKLKFAKPPDPNVTIAAGRLMHPPLEKAAVLTLLVESDYDAPFLYADVNMDGTFAENERFDLAKGEDDNPYILSATLKLPLTGSPFNAFPLKVQFFKNVRWDGLKEGERIILQSTQAFARGEVNINGGKVLVQYAYKSGKKIAANNCVLGVDGDGDGKVDMDALSPEAAEAREEAIVFRANGMFVSTKRADLEKNQIVMRSHSASDYKRIEVREGEAIPDFNFTDFGGKKRKLSEFRGKYVLLDFWGMWCGPCRRELPYLKAAYSRFQDRGLEIVGMNTDDEPDSIKGTLKDNGLNWTQARLDSIRDVLKNMRIHSFPTTILLDPEGKVISFNRRGQPRLRGQDLLKSLDELLPP